MNNKLLDYFDGDDLAANVWKSKYALDTEETPDDMHRRMAREFYSIETRYQPYELNHPERNNLSKYGQSRNPISEEGIYQLFKDFKHVIPQGSVMSQLGAPSIGSLSNCFVIGQPKDSYSGIFEKDEQMAQLMKRRGGVGIDISTLRPSGTPTSNAAKSSTGAISFMNRYSNTTREVAQNGRRGALMISIDINHPDVLDFIKIKRDLTKVTGANISIKLNNEFMYAVEQNADYFLTYPCNSTFFGGSYEDFPYDTLIEYGNLKVKRIKARAYWDEIIKSAHNVAEPGLMFWDNMVDYSPDGIYEQYKQITTNPCSEIGMQEYDACRLIAVNFLGCVIDPYLPTSRFDFDKFHNINYEAMRQSDNLVDLELQYIDRILDKIDSDPEPDHIKLRERTLWENIKTTASSSRRTGLGFTALGDTLAALGIKYDSPEALEFIDKLGRAKLKSELDCTIDLAILRGTFQGWDLNTEFDNYQETDLAPTIGRNPFYQMLLDEFPEETHRMIQCGRRNVSWSTVAPTGSVSLLALVTSGIEPLFQGFYTRRKKVNPNDTDIRVDFTDENGDTWQEFSVLHPQFKKWLATWDISNYVGFKQIDELTTEELTMLFEMSPWYGSTANDIDWIKRVEIQSTIQKYITHSISSTINLPENVSEDEVSKIYMESWRRGLKGITVYRDGSRSGVMVTKPKNSFEYKDATKRPKSLPAESYTISVKGESINVFVGLMDGKPYEVFAYPNKNGGVKGPGEIVKHKRTDYNFIQDGKSEKVLTDIMSDEQSALTRMISGSLRHGMDIKFIVEQLNKSNGDIFSFTKAIARVLKKYIPDGSKSTVRCLNPDCGSTNVIFEEGCNKCLDCGNSKCG